MIIKDNIYIAWISYILFLEIHAAITYKWWSRSTSHKIKGDVQKCDHKGINIKRLYENKWWFTFYLCIYFRIMKGPKISNKELLSWFLAVHTGKFIRKKYEWISLSFHL